MVDMLDEGKLLKALSRLCPALHISLTCPTGCFHTISHSPSVCRGPGVTLIPTTQCLCFQVLSSARMPGSQVCPAASPKDSGNFRPAAHNSECLEAIFVPWWVM